MNSKKILVVDDSPLIHNLISKAIKKSQWEVCANAKNGKEGIEFFREYRPTVTFMDINMPIIDGLTAIKTIKDIDQDAKVVLLTSVGDENTIKKAKILGVDEYLNKPFDDYKIISILSKL